MIPYPVHPDPMYKFRKSDGPCEPGAPVWDSAQLFNGEMCCSSCRKTMHLEDEIWVHN